MTDPAATAGPAADEGSARQNEIADTLRKLRKLVVFSGEELTENLPLYFNSVSLLEELEARVEDARLYMQGQERTAKSSGQRQWLARGVSPSGRSRCGQLALLPGQSSPRRRSTL